MFGGVALPFHLLGWEDTVKLPLPSLLETFKADYKFGLVPLVLQTIGEGCQFVFVGYDEETHERSLGMMRWVQ